MTSVDYPDWTSSALSAGAGYQILNWNMTINAGQGFVSPVVYCGNFPTLLHTFINLGSNTTQHQLQWYSDPNGTNIVYFEPFFYSAGSITKRYAVAVKAPYVNVKINNTGGTTGTYQATLAGMIGSASQGDALTPEVLSEGNPVNVAANTATAFLVNPGVAGPAVIWGFSGVTGSIEVQRWNGAAWSNLAQINPDVLSGATASLILPPDDVRVNVANTSAAAANFYYALTHGG